MTWVALTKARISDTQAAITELLGYTRPTFRAACLLTDHVGRVPFCEAEPKDQIDHLIQVANISVYEKLCDRAKSERRARTVELDRLAGSIERIETELANRDDVATNHALWLEREREAATNLAASEQEHRRALDALARARETTAAHQAALNLADLTRDNLEQARGRLEDLDRRAHMIREQLAHKAHLEAAAAQVEALEARFEELREAAAAYREAIAARTRAIDDRNRLRDERERLSHRILELIKLVGANLERVQAMERAHDAVCQTCGQPVADEAKVRAVQALRTEVEEADQEGEVSAARLNSLDAEITRLEPLTLSEPTQPEPLWNLEHDLRQARHAREKLAALHERETQLAELTEAAATTVAALPDLEAEAAEAQARADAIDTVDLDAAASRESLAAAAVSLAREAHAEATTARVRAAHELERLNTLTEEHTAAQAARHELEQDLAVLTLAEQVLSRAGLPTYVIENRIIPTLELHAQEALSQLGSKMAGAQIQLRTQRETKTGGLIDGSHVVLALPDGNERSYRRCSRGERTRIDLAVQRGFQKLVEAWAGGDAGLFCLDEPMGLDREGKDALVAWVREAYEEGTACVWLVSHDPDLRDAIGQVLELESDPGGGSRVVTAEIAEEVAA